ncbi:MAG: response regulator [Desulfovibrio sp.]|nr:MAG: response regulator [Desulfovibrio sp.]
MTQTTKSLTALVIEDSKVIRQLVGQILEDEGITMIEAADGLEGLENIAKCPDLIITDLNMPRMDGIEFLICLRSAGHCADTPVIVVSSENNDFRRKQAMAEGADYWLDKPFEPDLLVDLVRRALSRDGHESDTPDKVSPAANW